MYYEAKDFLETADKETLHIISNARKLTREYCFTNYDDTKRKNEILKELLGEMLPLMSRSIPANCVAVGNPRIIKQPIGMRLFNRNCHFKKQKQSLKLILHWLYGEIIEQRGGF